jgi:hypothetical protein
MTKIAMRDRIFEGDEFNGTYVAYGAAPCGCITPMACDVDIQSLSETRVHELRAYRQMKKRQGRTLRPLRDDAFHGEIFVIFGPDLSAKRAVAALEQLAENIMKDGLLIGRTEPDGDFYVETLDGKISG